MNRRAAIEAALRHLAPRLPGHEFGAVTDHALGSAGLRQAAPEAAAWLSLVAYARHVFTSYDELMAEGYDPDSARFFIVDELNEALRGWGVRREVGSNEG